MYENGDDYIGMHSDKTKTWKRGSNFQVIKWGCPRIFQVALMDHEDVINALLSFEKCYQLRTSITVDMDTNQKTRHGVPVMKDKSIGLSGSIVGRDIETLISFDESKKMIEQAKKDQLKRRALKEKKRKAKALKKENEKKLKQ